MDNEQRIGKPAFETVYTDYYILIYRYIYKKVSDFNIAEDLTSEIFYKAFKSYGTYNSQLASVKTWLFKITENCLKNYYRDKKSFCNIDDYTDEPSLIAEDAAYLQECRDVLAEALEALPERNRRIIILKYFYDKTADEIADELHITSGNVRILAMRTLQKLAKYFKSKGFNEEGCVQ